MGFFEDAIQLSESTGQPADITAVRNYNSRTGISLNLEQQLTPNLGFFARAGLADGNVEPFDFTDIDSTVAAGLSISGKQWGRPDDTWGIAGVINGISGVHEAFLNDGGLGILVGDGKLPHPGLEQIIETYYSLAVASGWRATADYQFIANPAYNQDRGPVSAIAARLHAQFRNLAQGANYANPRAHSIVTLFGCAVVPFLAKAGEFYVGEPIVQDGMQIVPNYLTGIRWPP